MNDFLPLGSIVLLKCATRYVVIIGYGVIEDDSTKVWDYLGCAYPIGVISAEKNLLFDKEQIDKVIFKGFSDNEGENFINELKESLDRLK